MMSLLYRWAGCMLIVRYLNAPKQKGKEKRELGIRSVVLVQSDEQKMKEFPLPCGEVIPVGKAEVFNYFQDWMSIHRL